MGIEDKARNSWEETQGKVKETAGRATDNEQLENEGKADQVDASARKKVENLKDATKNVRDAVKK